MEWVKWFPNFFAALPAWNQTLLAFTSIAFFGTVAVSFVNYGRKAGDHGVLYTIPSQTLRVIPEQRPWWHMGSVAGAPAMQIALRGHVTNVSRYHVKIVQTWAKIGIAQSQRGFVLLQGDDNVYGSYVLEDGMTREFTADYWMVPPVAEKGKSVSGEVVFVDQFGNQHPFPVTWQYR